MVSDIGESINSATTKSRDFKTPKKTPSHANTTRSHPSAGASRRAFASPCPWHTMFLLPITDVSSSPLLNVSVGVYEYKVDDTNCMAYISG